MYRFKRGVNRGYDEQGYIYFCSKLYNVLSQEEKDKILSCCIKCGEDYYSALFDFVTTSKSTTEIELTYNISQSTLHRIVRRYYETFPI